jgi:hypothetical protein
MTRRATQISQLTIRGFDDEVAARVRELARREHLSLNQAVMTLLRRATGLADARPGGGVGDALDHLAGTWTEADEREFADAIAPLERVDSDLWKAPPARRARRR